MKNNFLTNMLAVFKHKEAPSTAVEETPVAPVTDKTAEALACLKYAHHNIVKSYKTASNEAILCEDLDLNIGDLSSFQHRLEAAKGIEKYAELIPEQTSMAQDLEDLVFEGSDESLKTASSFIKTIYSSNIPSKNIKLAYTTLNTQGNEPYQMCPKAQKQIGWAIPMELSKCRDYCIDSRKTPDGHVTCAYQDWLRVVADNQANVLDRLEQQKIKMDNGVTLNEINRPGPAEYEESRESRREKIGDSLGERKYYDQESILSQSIEENLSKKNLNTKQSSDSQRTITASNSNNTREASKAMKKKTFNLAEYAKGNSINDKLDKYREFFKDSFNVDETPMQGTNKNFDNSKYESPSTNMETLIEEKRTGSPDMLTLNEQLADKHLGDIPMHTKTQEASVDTVRNNDLFEVFMKTLEEKLGARRHDK